MTRPASRPLNPEFRRSPRQWRRALGAGLWLWVICMGLPGPVLSRTSAAPGPRQASSLLPTPGEEVAPALPAPAAVGLEPREPNAAVGVAAMPRAFAQSEGPALPEYVVPSGAALPRVPLRLPPWPATFPHYEEARAGEEHAPLGIEGVERLDHYYSRLTLTDLRLPGAITRASQWGDSVIGGDGLTQAIREHLQRRFGDSGHGFHALGKYSRWYGHRGVHYEERRSWETCLIIFKCQSDRRYGYGGVTSLSRGRSLSLWRTVPEETGHAWSHFELWYQKRPDGGSFEIRVDGHFARTVDTKAGEVSDAVEQLQLPDGEHEIEVEALGNGVARGYGVVLERDQPGVVWDELSLIGSFIQRLDYEDPEHIAGQVRQRHVDLLAFMFGGNDLQRENTDLRLTTEPYEREYERVVRKFRAGRPQASCLILSMTDHAQRVNDAIVSRPGVARMVAAQRRVAEREGCAFYDTYTAMGGAGAVERGRISKPQLFSADLHHPSLSGQRLIGTLVYQALMQGYAAYRRNHEGQPFPRLGAEPLSAE